MERCQGDEGNKKGKSGFSEERINSTDNIVETPVPVHIEVTAAYRRHVPGTKTSLRDSLAGDSWDDQYNRGLDELEKAWKKVRGDT